MKNKENHGRDWSPEEDVYKREKLEKESWRMHKF